MFLNDVYSHKIKITTFSAAQKKMVVTPHVNLIVTPDILIKKIYIPLNFIKKVSIIFNSRH